MSARTKTRGPEEPTTVARTEVRGSATRRAIWLLVRFALVAVACYALLVAVKPLAREPYALAHAWVARGAFKDFGSEGMVRFEVDVRETGLDTYVLLMRRGVATGHRLSISAWRLGYLPTAELIALIIATPIAWRRRFRAMGIGLIVVHLLILARIWVLLIYRFSRDYPCRLYELTPLWDGLIDFIYDRAFAPTTASFLVPVIVWIAVTFRRSDVADLIRRFDQTR